MQRFTLSAVQVQVQNQAPLIFALGMILGTSWYFTVNFEPNFIAVLVGFAGAIAGLVLLARSNVTAGLVLAAWLIGGSASGVLAGSLATKRVQHVTLQAEIGPVMLEGWVLNALPAKRGTRLRLRVHAIDGVEADQMPSVVRVTHILGLETEPGRFVRCWAVLRPPPAPVVEGDYAFDRQAWYSGLGAVGYVQGRCRGGALGGPEQTLGEPLLMVSMFRRQLAQHVYEAAGDRAGGFAAALASGDRSFMSEADQEALRGAGLAHLLAISGLHMGIVGGLVFLLAWRVLSLIEPITLRIHVKKPAAVAALLACAAYLVISGASVSTQRAFIMAAILFGAVLIDRTALSLRSISIAMILILVLAPWSVLTPGFQMSFAATGALVATYERWNRRRRQRGFLQQARIAFWFKSLVVTSTVSSLATLPFALYHFERAAPLGLIANLFAMPIISLFTAPAAAAALILSPFGLDTWALRAFGGSLELVLAVAHYFSGIEATRQFAMPQIPVLSFILMVIGLIAFCMLRSRRGAWFSAALLGAIAIGVWSSSGSDKIHLSPSGEVFLERGNGAVERIEWRSGDGLAPLRFADHSVDRTCEEDVACRIQFGEHSILLSGTDPTDVLRRANDREILVLAEVPSASISIASNTMIYWSEIERENGITLELKNGVFTKRDKPECGSRVWRVCHSD